MARRRSSNGNPLLGLIAIVFAALAVVGPFVVALWLIASEFRARRFIHVRQAVDVVPAAERNQLDEMDRALKALEERERRIYQAGDAAGLMRRTEEGFDGRSPRARPLNDQLEQLAYQRGTVQAEREALMDQLGGVVDRWIAARSRVVGARAGLVVFVVTFVAALRGMSGELMPSPAISGLLFGTGTDSADRIAASAIATVAAGLAIAVASSINRSSIST